MIMHSLAIFGIMLVISFTLFAMKIIGAGDAKYITIASLWFGLHGAVSFLFLVSLAGGILAVLYLVFRDSIGRFSDWVWMKIQKAEVRYPTLRNVWIGSGKGPEMGKRENIGSRVIPYGIAIAIGSIVMVMMSPITHL
jgi:Flp pilus assembly protein protease CpaA